jgi:hypothetical protein
MSIDCYAALGEVYDRDAMPDHHFAEMEDAIAAWNRRTPANGEQVERGKLSSAYLALLTISQEDDGAIGRYAGKIAQRVEPPATLPTPTEDARERVKVLGEALEDRDRAKAIRNRHLLHMAVSGEMDNFGDWAEEAAIRAIIEFAAPVRDALGLALSYLVQNEPGDSRAVSDEFVAMAAIHAGLGGEKAMAVIRDAIARTALGNKHYAHSLSETDTGNPQKTGLSALGNKETDRHG